MQRPIAETDGLAEGLGVSSHPLNLALRFVLELAALAAVGSFGWQRFEGALRWGGVVVLPLVLMLLWGIFAVPDDPSRSGAAPVPVSGAVRLLIEAVVFGSAIAAVGGLGQPRWAAIGAGIVVLHYALSWDRIRWLLER